MGCESANENRHQKVINKNISLTNIEQAILQCK
jgi:hypothetical protein